MEVPDGSVRARIVVFNGDVDDAIDRGDSGIRKHRLQEVPRVVARRRELSQGVEAVRHSQVKGAVLRCRRGRLRGGVRSRYQRERAENQEGGKQNGLWCFSELQRILQVQAVL